MSTEMGPTNVTIKVEDSIVPEDMTPSMKFIIMPDGSVKFVLNEEYVDGFYS